MPPTPPVAGGVGQHLHRHGRLDPDDLDLVARAAPAEHQLGGPRVCGSDQAAVHLGGPGDGEVDGVINQNRLDIGRVYVQAKRYKGDSSIGRPDVQGFLGSLHHAGAVRGVFITTSRFQCRRGRVRPVHLAASHLGRREPLGQLMVNYGIGAQER